jgi:hypothetical protein
VSFHARLRNICASEEPLAYQPEAIDFIDLVCRHHDPDELAGILVDPEYVAIIPQNLTSH